MKLLTILFLIFLNVVSPAFSANYYVASSGWWGRQPRHAAGSRATMIQHAADNVNAADTVFIRGGTYSSASEISFSRSGSAGNLIAWKPEPGTGTPIIRYSGAIAGNYDRAIIEMFNISYNRFEGLTFGGPSGSVLNQAIKIFGNSTDFNTPSTARGNEIVGNTFSNIGVDGTAVGAASYPTAITLGYSVQDTLIDSNTFTHVYGGNITDSTGYHNTITNNNISSMLGACSYDPCLGYPKTANGIWVASDAGAWPTWTPGSTLKPGGYDTVSGNVIDGTGVGYEASGVRCDAGAHNMTIKNNVVTNLGSVGDTGGIYMESRCMNNLIVGNIVTSSRFNYVFSSLWIGSARYNTVANNVSYGGLIGFAIMNAGNNLFANNIVIAASTSQIDVSAMSVSLGSNVFSNNDFWRSGVSQIGVWNCVYHDSQNPVDNCTGTSANLTLAQFDASSGETASYSIDPLFVNAPSDFHLQAGSQVIDKGTNSLSTATIIYNPTCTGTCDMGAFEFSGSAPAGPNKGGQIQNERNQGIYRIVP